MDEPPKRLKNAAADDAVTQDQKRQLQTLISLST